MKLEERRIYVRLGEELRKHRERMGFSQARLAEAAGLRRTSVVNIEAGRQRPPLHALYALCNELGIEVGMILPPLAEIRTPDDHGNKEIVVEGQVRRVPAKAAGLVSSVLDNFAEIDKGAA